MDDDHISCWDNQNSRYCCRRFYGDFNASAAYKNFQGKKGVAGFCFYAGNLDCGIESLGMVRISEKGLAHYHYESFLFGCKSYDDIFTLQIQG